MSIDRERIFEVVKANTLKVLVDVRPEDVTIDRSLTDLGANSMDRVEVVMYSIEELDVEVPRAELKGIANLRGLVDLLHRHAQHSHAR